MCLSIVDEKKKKVTVGFKVVEKIGEVFRGPYIFKDWFEVGKEYTAVDPVEGIYFYLKLEEARREVKAWHYFHTKRSYRILKVAVIGLRKTGFVSGYIYSAGHADKIRVLEEVK